MQDVPIKTCTFHSAAVGNLFLLTSTSFSDSRQNFCLSGGRRFRLFLVMQRAVYCSYDGAWDEAIVGLRAVSHTAFFRVVECWELSDRASLCKYELDIAGTCGKTE